MPAPQTDSPTKTGAPTRERPFESPRPGPERHYQPERLCPTQRKDGTWKSRP